MAKHFGAQHVKSGYSAMGNAKGKPVYGMATQRSVAESIAHARRTAAREAAARSSKKK